MALGRRMAAVLVSKIALQGILHFILASHGMPYILLA